MTCPRLVPKYVNIEMAVVMDYSIPASAKQTYIYIKALSWGEESVIFTYREFTKLFGIPRSTLYRHLSLLATSSVLRFGSPGGKKSGFLHVEFLHVVPKRRET
jgi:hypothetical protein